MPLTSSVCVRKVSNCDFDDFSNVSFDVFSSFFLIYKQCKNSIEVVECWHNNRAHSRNGCIQKIAIFLRLKLNLNTFKIPYPLDRPHFLLTSLPRRSISYLCTFLHLINCGSEKSNLIYHPLKRRALEARERIKGNFVPCLRRMKENL